MNAHLAQELVNALGSALETLETRNNIQNGLPH
jgi:hypothetical protein